MPIFGQGCIFAFAGILKSYFDFIENFYRLNNKYRLTNKKISFYIWKRTQN